VTDGRKRIARVLATLSITAVGGSMLVAAPTSAQPDIPGVQRKVDKLYRQAEQASERYNNARLRLRHAQARLRTLQGDLHRQQAKVESVREQVATAVLDQAQGQALSSTAQVLVSDDPDSFLDQLTSVSQFNDQRSELMAGFAVQVKRLQARQADARRELQQIADSKAELGTEKRQIDEKAAQAKELLGTLKERAAERLAARREAEARAATARASRSQPRPVPSAGAARSGASASSPGASTAAPASGRAAAAVRYAMAQVGDAYVWGAAGPSAFDCSGLTMAAWAQAGVSLPHSSSAQMSSGTPVSQSELQPGDLVFYYSPVSHVGMYIGNGQIVNAENPSVGVKITGVNSMPYAGAVRPG
jgi:cell wall-associated NlpC family hydrolase